MALDCLGLCLHYSYRECPLVGFDVFGAFQASGDALGPWQHGLVKTPRTVGESRTILDHALWMVWKLSYEIRKYHANLHSGSKIEA